MSLSWQEIIRSLLSRLMSDDDALRKYISTKPGATLALLPEKLHPPLLPWVLFLLLSPLLLSQLLQPLLLRLQTRREPTPVAVPSLSHRDAPGLRIQSCFCLGIRTKGLGARLAIQPSEAQQGRDRKLMASDIRELTLPRGLPRGLAGQL